MSENDDDLSEVIRLEQRLLETEVRSDPAMLSALLHRDYLEFGRSGRVWDFDSIVAAVTGDPVAAGAGVDFVPVRLADDVVLLTYRVPGAAGSLRSSVWVRDPERGWQVRFHQGTPVKG